MSGLSAGFADGHTAQRSFRAVLRAMSRPGEVVTVEAELVPPAGVGVAAAAILLTLADQMTRVALTGAGPREWVVFHTGARLTAPETADFVVARDSACLATLRRGSDDEPEGGATLILDVPEFAGKFCRLSGPGIETFTTIELPVDDGFLAAWAQISRAAPCGVDVMICAGRRLVGLPRSVRIEAV